jgi:hypothetical protein
MNTHQGDVTDSLGIFRLPVHSRDTLLVMNISYMDTLVPVAQIMEARHILLRRKYYALQEARIFAWGSTYGDFRDAIVHMPNRQTLGESMGLPRQDPGYVPLEMNEEAIKSPLLLVTSPVSFFYYNFSKRARSERRVYWLKRNRQEHEWFNEITGHENISSITGLTGDQLLEFLAFLYQRMHCDIHCDELQIYTEIHELWKVYRELEE